MIPKRLSSATDFASVISNYDTWLFDCDGVLWNGDTLIKGVVEVLEMLRQQHKKIIFVTNNSTGSRREIMKKFAEIGVSAHLDEIYPATHIVAVYISSVLKLPKQSKVYLIGMKGLEEELEAEGILFTGGTDPTDCGPTSPASVEPFTPDPAVSAVLCGLDYAFTYTKLSKASRYLTTGTSSDPHIHTCHFIAVNTYPTAKGSSIPGAGALVEALKYVTGREPVCAGKPSSLMLECVRAKVEYDPKRTIMVGDRIDADIAFGNRGGLGTMLVLTGNSKESDLVVLGEDREDRLPDYVANSLGDFMILLQE